MGHWELYQQEMKVDVSEHNPLCVPSVLLPGLTLACALVEFGSLYRFGCP